MAKKSWAEREAERKAKRAHKTEAWLAHNRKHQPLLPAERSKLPKPKEV